MSDENSENYLLWAEKYRPRSLDEIVDQEETIIRLKKFVKEKNAPHMLFAGPPGTGKTTAALAFAHDLYGKNYQQFVLELNASDERGIDVIRGKIKEFARTSVVGGVPFKLIILDESDNLTSDAQQALRRMMENFTLTSRFILIANYPSKIIEPIQSRTALFRFSPLKKEDVIKRLKWILENESVSYEESALEAVFEISEGDMRKAINVLQSASAIGKVTVDTVYKVVGLAHPKEIREMLNLALSGDFNGARERLRKLMMDYGLSGVDVIKQIHKEIFSNEIDLSEEMKLMIADYTGEILFRITEGSDDEIQLNSFLAWLVLLRKRI
ncbi:replication factor C small subunit [Fervidicoccus fontis]|uniref:Replication factor C small subunit n=2 Tax=Fervidicoccus fontis TaxID=683846 RepID=I0A2Z1_FERFK|nr:replication factor C small subunit [Fervidicoccus fontis]AFH43348.1 replication factor C small subunit [Fervidicoccus fontis Kam940]MBE9390725.1 replication factor C small subunit [Fervidicoccus fontis]